jgi:hypothetical protein
MDIYLIRLLNFDGRTVYLNVPYDDIEDIEDILYLCIKKAALYTEEDRQYAVVTKK